MAISITITGDDEVDFRRQLIRAATPFLEGFIDAGGFSPEPEEVEVEPSPPAQTTAAPEPAPEPKTGGRPRGSKNKPKTNGNGAEPQPEAQTQTPTNGAAIELLALAEQIQIITDAAHDQPDKFKPLLVPLREQLGVQYISKALEKDRPTLQGFINEHGLAV